MTQATPATETTITTTITTTNRKRFSFGPVWIEAVKAGSATDHEKLIAHAVKLKVGTKSDMKRLRFDTLLGKVGSALQSLVEVKTPSPATA